MRGKEFSRRTASESDSIFIRKMLIEFPDGQRGPFETKIEVLVTFYGFEIFQAEKSTLTW